MCSRFYSLHVLKTMKKEAKEEATSMKTHKKKKKKQTDASAVVISFLLASYKRSLARSVRPVAGPRINRASQAVVTATRIWSHRTAVADPQHFLIFHAILLLFSVPLSHFAIVPANISV